MLKSLPYLKYNGELPVSQTVLAMVKQKLLMSGLERSLLYRTSRSDHYRFTILSDLIYS